jgi:hypothetical protein
MSDKAWPDGVRQVHREGAGMLTIGLFDLTTTGELLAAAAIGDETAALLVGALLGARKRVTDAPRNKPRLCVYCSRPVKKISRDIVPGVVFPAVPRPKSAIGFLFCLRCAADRAALFTVAVLW